MDAWVDLYWLPLGAGGWFVRTNGRLYERLSAWRGHRPSSDLYHSALMVRADDVTYAVEMGPVWNVADDDRGVLCEGPVGSYGLGRLRPFRYEVRCWAGGRIPEVTLLFGEALLRGNRAMKVDASGLDAFDSPRFPPLAEIGIDVVVNQQVVRATQGSPRLTGGTRFGTVEAAS